ncbi:MucR family transcriptional regulator [Nocardioides sp.]|uniref:MucR family transcriptional regulator n=1 Tax=Nocardioides sp. TaxID=35761 RepID=UPI002618B50C|nr:MucR family transcriptional regulator [Nocardioides sp.]
MRFGDPSGQGRFGILDDDGATVLCHECGQRFRSVGHHLPGAHGMTPAQYRAAHGLAVGMALVSSVSSERASASAIARGMASVEGRRDPARASAARDPERIARANSSRDRDLEAGRRLLELGYQGIDDLLGRTASLGPREASRVSGIPEATIRRWRKRPE